MEPLLSVNHLDIAFGGSRNLRAGTPEIHAVQDLSFDLGQREVLGIVGESGSGKSVTALAILRLLPSTGVQMRAASISFVPEPGRSLRLDRLSEKEMQGIRGRWASMVFQEPMTSLNPVFPCGKQTEEIILAHEQVTHKEARERVLSLFEEVRLPNPLRIFRAYPHELSGGQKQRVLIAMALSCNPSLLIADEPTTALDLSVQKTILELLKRLQQERGMGLIFISHDLSLVAALASRVLVLYRGRLVEEGSVDKVFQSPVHPYTQGLIACRPTSGIRVMPLPTIFDFLKTSDSGNGSSPEPKHLITPEERTTRHKALYQREPLIRAEGLLQVYEGRRGLFGQRGATHTGIDQVSFEVFPGETLGIVGESGCGKTTLARAVLRLIPLEQGKIWYRDQEITSLTPRLRKSLAREIQIVFQDPYASLNPRLPVGSALTEPLRVHRLYRNAAERRLRAEELLAQVGLDPASFGRYPHEFSGGQRQRICIARALALEPRVVICDESVSALDVSVQAQILNLLTDLQQRLQLTYLFISHDLEVVRYMSDRILVMHAGTVVEQGEPDAMYEHPTSEYTKTLLEARFIH